MSKQEQNRKLQREAFSPGNHQQDSCVSMALGGGGGMWHGHMSPIKVFPRLSQMFRFALMVSAAAVQICIANVTQWAVWLLRVPPPPPAIKLFFCPKVSLGRTNPTPWMLLRAAGVTGAVGSLLESDWRIKLIHLWKLLFTVWKMKETSGHFHPSSSLCVSFSSCFSLYLFKNPSIKYNISVFKGKSKGSEQHHVTLTVAVAPKEYIAAFTGALQLSARTIYWKPGLFSGPIQRRLIDRNHLHI